jgi:hypothetical protein
MKWIELDFTGHEFMANSPFIGFTGIAEKR